MNALFTIAIEQLTINWEGTVRKPRLHVYACLSVLLLLKLSSAEADTPVGEATEPAKKRGYTEQEVETRLGRSVQTEQKLADLLGEDVDTDTLKDQLIAIHVKWSDSASGKTTAEINELKRLMTALEKPSPEMFSPGMMTNFYCYYINDDVLKRIRGKDNDAEGLSNVKCDSSIDAYAYAAYWQSKSNKCWRLLDNMRYVKGFKFRAAVQEYLEYHQGKEACIKSNPPRCQLGYCDGDAKYGIVFRPAVEFTAGAGTGLGFEDHNNVGFTLTGSLGGRLFLFDDKVDVHLGVGIAALPLGDAPSNGMDSKSRSAFMFSPGIGFYGGLFGISGIFLFDPGGHDRAGKGLGITVDIVAIKNIPAN